MDSKVINKLIRSEVWPILRQQGFSVFDSRSAFAYKAPFINVVSFQSFNSYNAEVLGCTTHSFTSRLGVYVLGSTGEGRVKRDKAGRLRPFEYQCSFRSELKKRTPVDGFAREDIFYIDPDGKTTAQCFQELIYLSTNVAPLWFTANNDLDALLSRMQHAEESGSAPFPDADGVPRSYNWNRLQSVLLLLKHQQTPTQQSASAALDSIGRVMGTALDFSTIQSDRPWEERITVEMHVLWEKLGDFRPVPVCIEKSAFPGGSLAGPIWQPARLRTEASVDTPGLTVVPSAREQFWPMLKSLGFSEFTDRLAHRVSKHLVEVVEVLPMDPAERKASNLPVGPFRIGIGVFWPPLSGDWPCRKNRREEPRPVVNECHVSNWLTPDTSARRIAKTFFNSIEDASAALAVPGIGWLDLFKNHRSALSLLQREDWELFWCYPLMRGYGANSSCRRLVYIAFLEHMLGKKSESEERICRAEAAIRTWYFEHLHSGYEAWVRQVKAQLRELENL